MITHFCQFPDKATAQAQLAAYLTADGNFRPDIVDAGGAGDPGIPITEPSGQMVTDPATGQQVPGVQPKPGYFVNIILDTLNTSLPGLTGAGYRDPVTKAWVTLYGTQPAGAPQQEFSVI